MDPLPGDAPLPHEPTAFDGQRVTVVPSAVQPDSLVDLLRTSASRPAPEGTSGYLLKDARAKEVATAVRAARAGEVHLDPAVARLLAQRMREKRSQPAAEPHSERAIAHTARWMT